MREPRGVKNFLIIFLIYSFFSFIAQPVVQATTTVYTLPSSDPRYPGTNVSTSLRHVYGKLIKIVLSFEINKKKLI